MAIVVVHTWRCGRLIFIAGKLLIIRWMNYRIFKESLHVRAENGILGIFFFKAFSRILLLYISLLANHLNWKIQRVKKNMVFVNVFFGLFFYWVLNLVWFWRLWCLWYVTNSLLNFTLQQFATPRRWGNESWLFRSFFCITLFSNCFVLLQIVQPQIDPRWTTSYHGFCKIHTSPSV